MSMIAGCSGASSPTGRSGSATIADSNSPELLTTADLGDGWGAVPTNDPASSLRDVACLSRFAAGQLQGQHALHTGGYSFGDNVPAVAEFVGDFDAGQAAGDFQAFAAGIDGCEYPLSVDGQSATATFHPVKTGAVADASAAFTADVSGGQQDYSAGLVAMRKSERIAVLLYIDLGPPNTLEPQRIASRAAARL